MSTLLVVILALAAAGGLAWMVNRYETRLEPRATECSRAVDEVFAKGTNDTADSVLLKELLVHRDRCQGNAVFVDQARRLMANTGRFADARALLEIAESQRAMSEDEFKAQHAWIDAAEAQRAWSDGDESRAAELRERAKTVAEALRAKWPEWSMPYLILDDLVRSGPSVSGVSGTEYYALEREARSRKLNGAWIRSLSDWQPTAFTFVVAALAFLAFAAGMTGLIDWREMSGRTTSQIATAIAGYVELKGTLHLKPGSTPVIGPHTKTPALWYELQYNSGGKKATTRYTRSAQVFLLRDATGDVIVDPDGISVRTKHSTTTFLNSVGQANGSRTTENLLKEGDEAFALGDLSIRTDSEGKPVRHLRIAKDGRRLLVSNYSEAELIWMEKAWFTAGMIIFALGVLLLMWAYYQRYHVPIMPGKL